MKDLSNKILLNEILKLEDLDNVRIRFNLQVRDNWNPIEFLKNNQLDILLEGHYWNSAAIAPFQEEQVTVGFIPLDNSYERNKNLWLLFHVGKVTKALNKYNAMGYEYEVLPEYQKYFGRLVIRFQNQVQNMIRLATSVIDDCEVVEVLSDPLYKTAFPITAK